MRPAGQDARGAGLSKTGVPLALDKGAGDLAAGVATRLYGAGFSVVMTETASPTAVRRTVAFSEAVYEGQATVEDVSAMLAGDAADVRRLITDIDPRGSRAACALVSDKTLAVAGGVLEAACALLGGVRFD